MVGAPGDVQFHITDIVQQLHMMDKTNWNAKHYREMAIKLFKDESVTSHWCGPGNFTEEANVEYAALLKRPGFRPFSKMFFRPSENTFAIVESSFVNGIDAIEQRGIDLRYGWDPSRECLLGIVCLGPASSWAKGFTLESEPETCHGGVFHSILDEITAEVIKYQKAGRIVTSEVKSILLKAPLHVGEWASVEAKFKKADGVKLIVEARITRKTKIIATAEFVLCDIDLLEEKMAK